MIIHSHTRVGTGISLYRPGDGPLSSTDHWVSICSCSSAPSLQSCQGLSGLRTACPPRQQGFQHYPLPPAHPAQQGWGGGFGVRATPTTSLLLPNLLVLACPMPLSTTLQGPEIDSSPFHPWFPCAVTPAPLPTSLPFAVSLGGYPAPSHPPSARLPPPPPAPTPRPTGAGTLHTVLGVWVVGLWVRLRHLGGLVKQICHTVG